MGSGLPRFPQGYTCPVVLRHSNERAVIFVYGAFTLSGGPFQTLLLTTAFLQLSELLAESSIAAYNPHTATAATYHTI